MYAKHYTITSKIVNLVSHLAQREAYLKHTKHPLLIQLLPSMSQEYNMRKDKKQLVRLKHAPHPINLLCFKYDAPQASKFLYTILSTEFYAYHPSTTSVHPPPDSQLQIHVKNPSLKEFNHLFPLCKDYWNKDCKPFLWDKIADMCVHLRSNQYFVNGVVMSDEHAQMVVPMVNQLVKHLLEGKKLKNVSCDIDIALHC